MQKLAAQAYTYTTIDYPGSNYMVPVGINNSGQVVGLYSLPTNPAFVSHGFLFNGATFTSIDYPEAASTAANGINSSGQIVGDYYTCLVPNNYGCSVPYELTNDSLWPRACSGAHHRDAAQ